MGGLFYGDGTDQLVTQLIGVVSVFAFVTVTTGVLFLALKHTIGLRVASRRRSRASTSTSTARPDTDRRVPERRRLPGER